MAVNSVATAFAKIVPTVDAGAIKAELGKAVAGSTNVGNQMGKNLKSGMAAPLKGIGKMVLGAFSVGAITAFGKASLDAAQGDAKSTAILAQHTKTMGLFGKSTDQVVTRMADYASAISIKNGVEDDSIKKAQGLLMTFSELGKSADKQGGNFDRATQAAIDLAASGFGSVESQAVALGKALNDPAKRLTALERSGISFTDAQKAQITALQKGGADYASVAMGLVGSTKDFNSLVKANKGNVDGVIASLTKGLTPAQKQTFDMYSSGNHMIEAQNILLKAVEQQVGGTAEKSATASEKMSVAYGELQESVGNALLPTFEDAVKYIINNVIPAVQSFIEEFKQGKTPLNTAFTIIGNIFNFLKDNWETIKTVATIVGTLVAAFKVGNIVLGIWNALQMAYAVVTGASTAATAAFSAALAATGIGAIVIAVGLLIAGIVYLATQTTFFQDIWTSMTAWVSSTWNSFVAGFQTTISSIGTFFGNVFGGIGSAFKGYVNFWIGLVEGFVNFFITGVNNIIRAINKIKLSVPNWVPLIGGKSWGPNLGLVSKISLPRLAEGGLVMPQPGGVIANIAEAKKPEVVYPLDRFEKMMNLNNANRGNITVNNYAPVGMSSEEQITRAIERSRNHAGW